MHTGTAPSDGASRTDRLRAGVGTSESDGAREAGVAAASAALAELGEEPAALVLVYASVRYDLPELLAGVRSVTGDVPLAGATSSGQFHNGEVTAPGRGVAVLTLTAGPYRYGVASVTGLQRDGVAAGRNLARAAKQAAGPHRAPHAALVVLVDALAGNQPELLAGVHKVTGAAVPVVGGAAGDDRMLSRTSVFDGDQVYTDGAVGVWIDSPWPLRITARHGWEPVSLPLLITKADGPVVQEIAGRPALEVYNEHFHETEQAPRLPAGWRSAQAFGLIEPDGSVLIRGAYLGPDGQLRTFSPLPVYSPVQIVTCQPDSLLGIVEQVVADVSAGRDPSVLLAFSCSARLDVLGERVVEEAKRLQVAAGTAATIGFYTYGEIARTSSVAGYHNATLTAIAL